ncbi:hypothetical protein C8J55DRAFT_493850 [Lentinula edodes]|uniref:Uncharacterized protein n=1 Tax=Lentinula lateritia TaxID=40482 RepID=A0A9W8ZRE7_9AGAR|nr:hypothetical protein C8J55DRAFT_493850 [Lentinula edodes]
MFGGQCVVMVLIWFLVERPLAMGRIRNCIQGQEKVVRNPMLFMALLAGSPSQVSGRIYSKASRAAYRLRLRISHIFPERKLQSVGEIASINAVLGLESQSSTDLQDQAITKFQHKSANLHSSLFQLNKKHHLSGNVR